LKSADVIIIGGGIVGSSVAYHLTEAGCRNVLVIERESHPGKGSTGNSTPACLATSPAQGPAQLTTVRPDTGP